MANANNVNNEMNQGTGKKSSDSTSEISYAWFVGAKNNDNADMFIREGRWENNDSKFDKKVKNMKPGDRIVIKAANVMKKNIPFNSYGLDVSFIYIKAIGTIIANRGDGKNITVDWERVDPPKKWYTYTGAVRNTASLIKSSASVNYEALLKFVFDNVEQDYSMCEKFYEEEKAKKSKRAGKKSIFEGFQAWLTTFNNPDYDGKYKYDGYAAGLKKIVNFMFMEGLISSNDLDELDVERYKSYYSAYIGSQKAIDYDYDENSSKTGGAALQKYILYIKYLIHPAFGWESCVPGGTNLVVYGTPGCGKSYYVDHNLLGKNNEGKYDGEYKAENIIRTTFFQDYSYTDFVGQIVPEIEYQGNDQSNVTYRFVPGPFTLALEKAIAQPSEKVALVVEELNRGNAPSIFGDLFQLLDRIEDEGKEYPVGTSEYGILNSNIINYLKDDVHYSKKYHYSFDSGEIRLPCNLSIFATMNTSDQNVFTLDTAFKRRWEFYKLRNEFDDLHKHAYENLIIPGLDEQGITWRRFVTNVNNFILKDKEMLFSEDKQIGIYFVPKKMLLDPTKTYDETEKEILIDRFAYKVFEYLWNDVAKFSRDKWFVGNIKSLDDLISNFKNKKAVFADDVFQQ